MDQALAAWRQHLELKRLLADIRLDLLRLEYLRKYRPDQPRDEIGRWTGDGGSSADDPPASFAAARRRGRSEAYCWAQLGVDTLLCSGVTPASRRAAFRAQAMERYANCLAGRPIPPLNY